MTAGWGTCIESWCENSGCNGDECGGDYTNTPATLSTTYSAHDDCGVVFPAVSLGRVKSEGELGVYLEVRQPAYRLADGKLMEAVNPSIYLRMREARQLLADLAERLTDKAES